MQLYSRKPHFAALAAIFFLGVSCLAGLSAWAQSTGGTVTGTVKDPSGAVVTNSNVEIKNPVSGLSRTAPTDIFGNFNIANVPFNNYHLTAAGPGFAAFTQDVEVRSTVPVVLNITLQVATSAETVTVEAEGADLLETSSSFHTDVDRELFEKLPLESQSSSVSSLVTLATPGISADSNGLFHGMGEHADNSFSVDGQPITDQQSKVFSNQIPLDSIESMEVFAGAPPAEFGGKTSAVINVTTRSGQGVTSPHGAVTASYGSFGTANLGFNVAYGSAKWGNFISANGLNGGRFLDPPEFAVIHAKGNQENLFDRLDYQLANDNSLHLNLGFTRSWFQTPNSFDAENATAWNGAVVSNGGLGPDGKPVGPADQRSQIQTFNFAPSWTRVIDTTKVFALGAFLRRDHYDYYGSNNPFADLAPNLQSETVGQDRTLLNAGIRASLSYAKGVHNLKVGTTYEQTFLTENTMLGVVDPTFLPSLTDTSGKPCFDTTTGRALASPCTDLLPYDLTRSGVLFPFHGHTDVKELALYVQDTITKGSWSVNLGLRGDSYHGLAVHNEIQPRLGVAYTIKRSGTVLRVSYARVMETPFNENLVLSSTGCSSAVLNVLLGCSSHSLDPISPGWRNEFHAGLQQAIGHYLVLSGEYMWKYSHNAYDFSVLGSTPITFPIVWHNSKIPGFAGRVSVPNIHGFSAQVVFSSVAARFFLPQVGGAGATPSAPGGVFRIDHDEKFNQTTHLQYQPWQRGPWVGFNWRYDSGAVAGRIPCAGGDCNNGPDGTATVVDFSKLSPDQQFQAGLSCGAVRATPTTPISPTGLCPASQYGSQLLSIPAAGTANADQNPPRIAPRHLFDLSVGHDNLFHGDHYKVSLQLTAVNLANETALYNFLSTFSGTHYVTPRSYTVELGFHF